MIPAPSSVPELLDRYDAVFLDAYGVLNDAAGALPGAADLIVELERRGLPWALCTNDASRLPETVARRLAGFGIPIRPAHVVTAGMLVAPYFAAHGLAGRRCIVLGTADSRRYVEDAGGVVIAPGEADVEVIVVGDDGFDPFRETIEATLTAAVHAIDAGRALALVLPNPDLIYPRGKAWGVTAGAIALVLEAALARKHPGAPRFVPLGKPRPDLFLEARRRLGLDDAARAVMIGDQLDTDIAGALAAGVDAALVAGGVSTWAPGVSPEPTWLLPSITLRP